jgi:hypothetical protein
MHKDCFAFSHKNGSGYCRCLSELVCACADSKCSFFKTKTQFNVDLARHNGTTDLAKLSKDYVAKHGLGCTYFSEEDSE